MQLLLEAKGTDHKSRLQITTTKKGVIWLDQVSAMPVDTYKVYFKHIYLFNFFFLHNMTQTCFIYAYLFYVYFFFLCIGTWFPKRAGFHDCRFKTKIYEISRYSLRLFQFTSCKLVSTIIKNSLYCFNLFALGHWSSIQYYLPRDSGVVSLWK